MRCNRVGWLVLLMLLPASPAGAMDAVVDWAHKVEMALPVSGVIAEVNVGAGQVVKKGDTLLSLETAPFVSAVQQAEAALVRARLQYKKARRDDDQARELYERQVLSNTQLEDAAMALQDASATVKDARARLEMAKYEMAKSRLSAPFDAVVLEVKAVAGQTIISRVQAHPLVLLASHGQYLARATTSASQGITIGQQLLVKGDGIKVNGKVRSIVPVDGDIKFELVFGSDKVLRPGARVEIHPVDGSSK
ncbi:MAG: efflux RND transporter periplasmic adaptor subunit [Gammaproteobacteria bacterium]|nr:efflux RND transporter periplasmic adaptor subunit [Gammaproteobacteria bacterium]